jgi:hypothetical protein
VLRQFQSRDSGTEKFPKYLQQQGAVNIEKNMKDVQKKFKEIYLADKKFI